MSTETQTHILVHDDIYARVRTTYGAYYERLSHVTADKLTNDVLSVSKIAEQVAIIERYGELTLGGKRVLEIGSGYGLFVAETVRMYGADTIGVEPASEGFESSLDIARDILISNNVDTSRIVEGTAERLPFETSTFDVVYSTNVFEHVQNPAQAFSEAIRVCKPGGFIQIVIPNYGSFYEGHYATWYIPHVPKRVWKLLLRYVQFRDPSYADTLRTELTHSSVKRILRPYEERGEIATLGFGIEIFKERMNDPSLTPYAGLGRLFRIIRVLRTLGLIRLATGLLVAMKAHSPLIISIRKSNAL